ncbi:hypothetical protein J2I47_03090 [Fibrella sp. HMF5335]|uniref:Lipoprotein n=1 Tax=Fibrella rubiginis TaxID=2817060 RepID=A0A939GDH9_9BACT|nr:hypothetical protein [Fibrella rubiginis]MBO0935525.1 hypothetical protein [Fibrella rubiginis]
MKQSTILLALAVVALASCRPSTVDDANDAGGTASPYLARTVVGVRMLSNDANYDEAGQYLAEEFVRGTFKLGEDTKIEVINTRKGGMFKWDKNEVVVSFGSPKPYPSIYHAEYVFNKLYQPGLATQMDAMPEKEPLSGPAPEGTSAERPAESATGLAAKRDTSAANDTATSVSRVTAAATQLTAPAESTGKFVAYPGLGDKAVWDPTNHTMHVLLNNHILNVQVKTADKPAVAQQRAAILANVIFHEVVGDYYAPDDSK